MDIKKYFELMPEKGASDLFFSVGAPVSIKIKGQVESLETEELEHAMVEKLAYSLISEAQRAEFEKTMELNFAHDIAGVGRYRINLYRQRGEVSMVVRYIKSEIPTMEELQLPEILKTLVMEARGLILIVGATGSGKSSTLASMVDYRNSQKAGHILTIEDPIEYLYTHKKAVVDQREIGIDTLNYENALKNAMREAPDVIMIGEVREKSTMQHAISYAETGHLCLSTLHANNANQTIDRIINFFPENAQKQLLIDLSLNLKAVISQRLLPGLDGNLVPVFEILLKSAYISELIQDRKIEVIKEAIANSREIGMQTFDQSLYDLYTLGKISEKVALDNSDSRINLSIKLNLEKGGESNDPNSNLTLK
jgi:twitching motility protein PilU